MCVCGGGIIAWKGTFQAMKMDLMPKGNILSQVLICTLNKLASRPLNAHKYQSWPTLATARS